MSASVSQDGRRLRLAVFVLVVALLALVLLAVSPPATAQVAEPAALATSQLDYTIREFGGHDWYTAVQLADMDGDGYQEILIGNRDEYTIEIWHHLAGLSNWYNDGAIPFDYQVHDFKVADIDGDGDMDVVAGLRGLGLYYVENTSYYPGTYASWDVQEVNQDYTWQVLVEDFDKDGHLDIFQGVDDGPIYMFYGDGHGNFVQGAAVEDPATEMRFPMGFNAVDLNGDNRLDLIGVDGSYLRAFLNPGNRASDWTSAGPTTPYGTYPCCDPTAIVANLAPSAADLDGNGVIDQVAILGTPESDGPLQVLLLKGSKSGSTLTWDKVMVDTITDTGWGTDAGVADLDGDGNLDIYVGGFSQFNGLYVYLGDGKGGFTPQVIELDHGVGEFNTVAVSDLNIDSGMDIVTNRYTADSAEASGFEILFGAPTQPSDWQFECVDCPPNFGPLTEHSLQYDTQGRPHIAFGGNLLYYAWHDGQNWQTEIVDDSRWAGDGAALVIDQDDRAHIAYYAGTYLDELRYAYQTADGWHIETVAQGPFEWQQQPTLAIDTLGRPHIAFIPEYGDAPDTHPQYALKDSYDSDTWKIRAFQTDKIHGLSLTVDALNRALVSYVVDDGYITVTRLSDERTLDTIEVATAPQYNNTSIAVKGTRYIHIAADENGAMLYIHLDWQTGNYDAELVSDQYDDLGYPSLVLDQNGKLHIAFTSANTQVMYATKTNTGWVVDPYVGVQEGTYPQVSLAVDADGVPGIVYTRSSGDMSSLSFTQLLGRANWFDETVIERGAPAFPDLALDSLSRPVVSYYDWVNDDLKVAHLIDNEWTSETVENVADALFPLVDLDSAGNAHIVYKVGFGAGKLKYARQTANGWQQETVKSGAIGLYSFALDPNGEPHIVYGIVSGNTGSQTQTLTYTYHTGAGWQSEDLYAAGYPAEIIDDLSLAVDSQGQPHVAMLHRNLNTQRVEVRYAMREAGIWTWQEVDNSEDYYYLSVSLDVDRQDEPHLVYAWSDGGAWIDITYAHRTGPSWEFEPAGRYPNPPESEGTYPTMALGPDDQPQITYYDVMVEEVWYGVRTATGWQLEVLEDWGSGAPAIAVDRRGQPHLANFGGGLRYAMKTSTAKPYPIYLPHVVQTSASLPGTGWTTGMQFQNVGQAPADIQLWVFASTGPVYDCGAQGAQAGGSVNYLMDNTCPAAPSDFNGSGLVVSEEPVAGIVHVNNAGTGRAGAIYISTPEEDTATSLFFPLVKHAYHGRTTAIAIQNAGDDPVDMTATYRIQGKVYTKTYTNVPARAKIITTPLDAAVPAGNTQVGSLTVTATGPIAGTSLEYQASVPVAENLQAGKAFTPYEYAPTVFCPLFRNASSGQTTGAQVQNLSDHTQTVTLVFTPRDGGPTVTAAQEVKAGESGTFYAPFISIPAGSVGSATVSSSGNIVAVVNDEGVVNGYQRTTTYACFPISRVTNRVVLPLYKEFWFGNTSGIQIQNVGTEEATMRVTYIATNKDASVTFSPGYKVPAGSSTTFFAVSQKISPPTMTVISGDPATLANTYGSVVIESDTPIVAIANESGFGPNPSQQDSKNYEGFNK